MLLRAITDPKLATAPVLARLHAHQSVIEVHTDNDTKAAERSIAKAIKALDSTPAAGRDLGWMQARSTVRKAQLELADLSDDMPRVKALAESLAKEVGDWPAEEQTRSEERRVGKECVSTCRSRWSQYI